MKRLLAVILTMTMLLSVTAVSTAAEESASIEVDVDYLSETISVTYTTNLDYDTYVNIYMAPADNKTAVFKDFEQAVRMDMVQCGAKSSVTAEFKLGADIDSLYYDFYAAPGGKNGEMGYAKAEKAPYIISKADRDNILSLINSASVTDIAAVVYEHLGEALGFVEETCPVWKNEYLFEMRKSDFGGSFKSAGELLLAWDRADAIYSVRNAAAGEEKAVTDAAADTLGIDNTNSDYLDFNNEFIKRYISRLNSENVVTKSANLALYNECLAITAINERSNDTKAKAFEQYAKELGITDILDDIEAADEYKVARHLEGYKADNTSDIKNKIKKIIKDLEKHTSDVSSSGGGGGGGGGRNSGGGSVTGGAVVSNNLLEKTEDSYNGRFADMSDSHWAKVAVESLASMNIINGYSDGTFGPDKTVTREEFVKMIVSAFSVTAKESELSFDDVPADFWASQYIYIAEANGIISGIGNGRFGVGQPITRQDMAVIMSRVADFKGIPVAGTGAEFTDSQAIADYAVVAVSRLAGAGIVNGTGNGSFNPAGSLTRAEAAKVIYELVLLGRKGA